MKSYHEMLLAILIGAGSGMFILGIIGRAATAGIALVTGNSVNLSLRGALEVVAIGALMGAIGGILLLLLRNVCRGNGLARGIIAGLTLFVCSTLFVSIDGRFAFNMSVVQVVTLGVVAAVFVIYGVFASKLIMRFNGERIN